MMREIFRRIAVICFALAAVGFVLLIGTLASMDDGDLIPFSFIVGAVVMIVLWPMRPLACACACAKSAHIPLPYRDSGSLVQGNDVSEDGRKGVFVESGEE